MTNPRPQIPNSKSQIALWAGGLLLLGAVAWGIGWMAHGLFGRTDAPAAERATATSYPAALPTALSPVPPAAAPTSVPPTSTPAPALAPTPAPATEWEFVQPGEGLYQVCRRHCPGRWPPDDQDLEEYAQAVARLNNLSWPDPPLDQGQKLQMPSCP